MQRRLRAALASIAIIASAPVFANEVENFYKGRNISFLVGVSQGGGYDTDLRLVARHITKHIPGRPNAVPQNMTGATGLVMANYMYRVAPRDGSVVALIQNGLPTYQAVGREGVQFDAREFQWIGSVAPTVEAMITMVASNIRTVEDAKKREVIAGSNGASGITYMYPLMMNDMLGTRFKMVTGYPGSGQLNLAMERGEVDARNNSWTSIKSTKPNWIKDKLIHVLVYSGPQQDDLPGVPHFLEMIQNPEDRAVARVVTSGGSLGRPFTVAPGVPTDRVAALRTAFTDMLKDPEFIKDATSMRIELQPISHQELKKVIDDLFATPDHLKERARKYFN